MNHLLFMEVIKVTGHGLCACVLLLMASSLMCNATFIVLGLLTSSLVERHDVMKPTWFYGTKVHNSTSPIKIRPLLFYSNLHKLTRHNNFLIDIIILLYYFSINSSPLIYMYNKNLTSVCLNGAKSKTTELILIFV